MAIAQVLADFNLAVVEVDRQTAKFNSPPNFPAIYGTLCFPMYQQCDNDGFSDMRYFII